MKPFFLLIIVFIISLAVNKLIRGYYDIIISGKIAMAAMFVFTSMGHFVFTKGMSSMIPNLIPCKAEITIASGILELVFAVLILFINESYKSYIGWLIIAFLILILPANIKACLENLNYETGEYNGNGLGYLLYFRIPFQILLICWTYFFLIRK